MGNSDGTSSGPAIVDFAGQDLTAEDRAVIVHPATAGVILFGRNIDDAQQVRELTRELRSLRPDLLICIDQEGGRVQRLKKGVTRLPPMAALGARYQSSPEEGLVEAKELGWLMARELRSVGIDLSFAPVLDLDTDFCAAIGDRSFGCDPNIVTALASAFISGMGEAGMGAVGKHFPGHGKVAADSHFNLPVDHRSLAEIHAQDLIPFRVLCHSALVGVMPAHIIFSAVDEQPVGFSRLWLQKILRGELEFNGLIFSDDLSMAAAEHGGDFVSRSLAALNAGCDLLLLCNNRTGALGVLDVLVDTKMPAPTYQQKCRLICRGVTEFSQDELDRQTRARSLLDTLLSSIG